MKYGQWFKQRLKNDGFPPDWVDSAISYSQLKKCINKLTAELASVGLDAATLSKLLKHVEEYNTSTAAQDADDGSRSFEYILADNHANDASSKKPRTPFHPKLLFHVNESTGEILGANLDDKTRKNLQMLAVETGLTELRVFEEPDTDSIASSDSASCTSNKKAGYRTVEVPLTSDSEFFSTLATELSGLEQLQDREEKRMHNEIEGLGRQVARMTDPDRKSNRRLLAVWREIFQVYIESDIFFGHTESDHAAHNADKATERFQKFCNTIATQGLVDKIKKPEGLRALNTFMHINREILQGLRFGEINHTAMLKILKKFDKQTALGVKSSFPQRLEYPEFSEHLAKATCAELNNQILSSIPQLEDYSCPMCMELKWRPVRLRCGHTFCIRCLIVMQTDKQHNCPLCREKTVVDACSDNLDLELADFLKKWFPDEVKAKQKYNELMAGVDQYGEVYKERCVVM
ncbi:hypothetical protein EJ04DRAFT_486720 [Polyplosphaeria fusca]|uniref:RING-14 protein-like protein n=1 Tax=Polyplosphaeria fusca TaxID=682080 RepID=A0A9P4R7F9_9PLEO|nr:hypothetical protein EJ04DRAFT_486720 [Polyplosphaeria fusca]